MYSSYEYLYSIGILNIDISVLQLLILKNIVPTVIIEIIFNICFLKPLLFVCGVLQLKIALFHDFLFLRSVLRKIGCSSGCWSFEICTP